MSFRFAIAIACLGLAACQPSADSIAERESALALRDATAFFERRWYAVAPCADCAGIELALVLRQDFERREYRLIEAYLANGGRDYEVYERSGAWTVRQEGAAIVYVLDPEDVLLAHTLRVRSDGSLYGWSAGTALASSEWQPISMAAY